MSTLDDCTFVIFGVTGNLARIKLLPALYHLDVEGLLPEGTKIIGIGRDQLDQKSWISILEADLQDTVRDGLDKQVFKRFCNRFSYSNINLTNVQDYQKLVQLFKSNTFPQNIAFYFSLPPNLYSTVVNNLGSLNLLEEKQGWRRVVVEKPFGSDLESAKNLQRHFDKYLNENQTFRIDHYLGKETVQNVQVFRFANVLLEPLWNRNYIDHVQITHSETIGIGSRGGFYDDAGALRDMVQSHLLQLLSLVAMEPPVSMQAEDLRNEKVKLLRSISSIPKNAVSNYAYRAQYTNGEIDGKRKKSYLEEEGIPTDSVCETYAAVKLSIDNWRWRDVPFYLRTGKRMAEKCSMIAICFKDPPKQFFKTSQLKRLQPNWLLIGIQPDESLRMELTVKKPGLDMETKTISLDTNVSPEVNKDAYEGLLLDVIEGDHTLFLRSDEVEQSWKIVDPIISHWNSQTDYISTYPAGCWGPDESNRLFEKDGQKWRSSLDPIDE